MGRILHVEDDPRDQELARAILRGRHEVVTVGTLADAIALVRDPAQEFDGIFLDMQLPDSTDMLAAQKLVNPDRPVPIFVLTGFTQAIQHGIVRILDKAIMTHPDEFRAEADRLVALKRQIGS